MICPTCCSASACGIHDTWQSSMQCKDNLRILSGLSSAKVETDYHEGFRAILTLTFDTCATIQIGEHHTARMLTSSL